jgi:pre-mRNA-splicing factor SYF1
MLMRCKFYEKAAILLIELAQNEPPELVVKNEEDFDAGDSIEYIQPNQYWQRLCEIVTQFGGHIKNAPIDSVLRGAIEIATKKSDFSTIKQVKDRKGPIHTTGIFWNALATWHIRSGRFEQASTIYEEAINSVPTVRDFALVFDAYSKMEESIIGVELERVSRKKIKSGKSKGNGKIEERIAKFEILMI